ERDLAADGRIERRVVARADERRLRLVWLVQRRAVQRDRAARVRADLRVRDDSLCGEALVALDRVGPETHDDEWRPERLLVCAFGERRVEVQLLDVVRLRPDAIK